MGSVLVLSCLCLCDTWLLAVDVAVAHAVGRCEFGHSSVMSSLPSMDPQMSTVHNV